MILSVFFLLWLQLDIKNGKARELIMKNKIYYMENKCTKITFDSLHRRR